MLNKKFEKYKTKSSDTNSLMAYMLGKLARERALVWKYKHDVEELHKVPVEIPINHFMNEVRDYG